MTHVSTRLCDCFATALRLLHPAEQCWREPLRDPLPFILRTVLPVRGPFAVPLAVQELPGVPRARPSAAHATGEVEHTTLCRTYGGSASVSGRSGAKVSVSDTSTRLVGAQLADSEPRRWPAPETLYSISPSRRFLQKSAILWGSAG